jgi:hypothetical protein
MRAPETDAPPVSAVDVARGPLAVLSLDKFVFSAGQAVAASNKAIIPAAGSRLDSLRTSCMIYFGMR